MRNVQFDGVAAPRPEPHYLAMPNTRRPTFIRQWRVYRGFSQEELADRIDMSKGNLSQIERGLINYTHDSLERLADALDCDLLDLLSRDPKDSESLWSLWHKARPGQREQMVEIGRTILKGPGK